MYIVLFKKRLVSENDLFNTYNIFAWHIGMSSTGKSFLKSMRKTPSIKEVDEEQSNDLFLGDERNRDLVIFSRDRLEPEGQSNRFSFNPAYL